MKKIRILLFENVELLDFAGPLEVFGVAGHIGKGLGISVSTVGFKQEISIAKTALKVSPQSIIDDEECDLFLLPGGIGTLQQLDPTVTIDTSRRFIDNGKILTSAGISAGIDMSLYLVEKYYGKALKEDVREYLEYKG